MWPGRWLVALALLSGGGLGDDSESSRCEEITIPMCQGIPYNLTSFPNEMNHESQKEAGMEVNQYWPLVEIKCSPDLRFFLCSIYTPICLEDYAKPLPPCRSVCERARAGCSPIMRLYNFPWPERMACERLPVYGDQNNLCMDESPKAEPEPRSTRRPQVDRKGGGACKGKNSKNCREPAGDGRDDARGRTTGGAERDAGPCGCGCRPPLVPLAPLAGGTNRSGAKIAKIAGVADCAFPCKGAFYTSEERDFAAAWLALWSALCAASTLATLATFVVDPQRFKYPERPIVFLSACYFVVAIGYLLRIVVGRDEVACDGDVVRRASNEPTLCTLVFLLVYFFGMASSVWWVVLSFAWFLAAGLKWGNEAIAGYSQYFHLAAWLIPAAQSAAALLSSAVDGDPVAGVCYVGNLDPENLKRFVVAPLLVYLAAGTSFLAAGFVSLFRIRSAIKRQGGIGAGSKADKLEKLMIRIGVFSVLYTVPAAAVLGCHLYEAHMHGAWLRRLACSCSHASTTASTLARPLYALLVLKYFMALAVGITSGVWIWSGKTLDSWRRFFRRAFGGGGGRTPAVIAANALEQPPGAPGSTASAPLKPRPPKAPLPRPPAPPRSHV